MKRMKILLALIVLTFAYACGQKADDTFTKPVYFNQGLTTTRITFTDGTFMTTVPTGTGSVTWDAILNKPTTFPSTWTTVSGKSTVFNPDLSVTNPLYKPIGYIPTYEEITGKPESIPLDVAISQLSGVKLPVLTTVQINALTPALGTLVYDSDLNVLKIYTGTWKTVITAN
jgi:hypothetical protein